MGLSADRGHRGARARRGDAVRSRVLATIGVPAV